MKKMLILNLFKKREINIASLFYVDFSWHLFPSFYEDGLPEQLLFSFFIFLTFETLW